MSLSIKSASILDADLITKINTDAYNDETNRFGPGRNGGPRGYNEVNVIKDLLTKFPCYKIVVDDWIIGWFWLKVQDANTVELEDFCIAPQYHNKGFGYKTLLKMHACMPEKKKWILGTPHYSVKNQYLYEKAGYIKTGITEDGFLFLYEKIIE